MKKLLLLPFLLLVIPVVNATGEGYNEKFERAISRGDLVYFKHELDNDHYLDINQIAENDYSGLMLAAYYGHKNIVGHLLEVEGIDIYYKCKGATALDIAEFRNKEQVIEILKPRIAKDLKEVNRIRKKIKETIFTAEQKYKLRLRKIYLKESAYKWINRIKKGEEFLKADDLTTNLISSLKKLEQDIDELPKTPNTTNKKSTTDIVWYKTTGGGVGIVIVVLSGAVITSIIYKKNRSQRHQNGGRNRDRNKR